MSVFVYSHRSSLLFIFLSSSPLRAPTAAGLRGGGSRGSSALPPGEETRLRSTGPTTSAGEGATGRAAAGSEGGERFLSDDAYFRGKRRQSKSDSGPERQRASERSTERVGRRRAEMQLGRKVLRLQNVRETLQAEQRVVNPHADAHGGEAVRLRHVREAFQTRQLPESPRVDPHRREALRLCDLWATVQAERAIENPHANPHRRAAVRLRRVRAEFLARQRSESPREDPHRGEAVCVWDMRGGIQTERSVNSPPEESPRWSEGVRTFRTEGSI